MIGTAGAKLFRPQDRLLLDRAYEVAWRSRKSGNHPFGALLANDAGEILLEGENKVRTTNDPAAHAEVNLLHDAARVLPSDLLAGTTMYASAEPCAMCAATAYWVGISRVVYGLAESELYEIIGPNSENLTLQLECRAVFARGQRAIEVIGPTNDHEARELHKDFWN